VAPTLLTVTVRTVLTLMMPVTLQAR